MNKYKIISLLVITTIISGCANKSGFEHYPYKELQTQYPVDKAYNIDTKWWTKYNDIQLNQMVDLALINNIDLASSAIKVNQALYQANLLGADLVPTFSGNASASTSKNIKSGGNSNQNFQGSLNISYTIDLWNRLSDSASAKEWTYKATQEDLEATKLTIINSVIDNYFHLKYLHEIKNINIDSLNNYKKIYDISLNKNKYGLISNLDVIQSQQSIESTNNNINSLDLEIKKTEQILKNLLNYQPNNNVFISNNSLLDISLQGIDLSVPVSTIANRPDLKSYEYRLLSSFKDKTAMEKSIYPDITIGSSISSSNNKLNNSLNVPIAAANIAINLPFLDWNHVKWNIKISQSEFEQSKLDFEKAIVTSLNEIDTYYFTYNNYINNYNSLKTQYENNIKISQYYKIRYEQGISDMSDWLNAIQTENTSKQSIVQAKYELLSSENNVYQAMAGKYKR